MCEFSSLGQSLGAQNLDSRSSIRVVVNQMCEAMSHSDLKAYRAGRSDTLSKWYALVAQWPARVSSYKMMLPELL